jgi:predicted RNase H-like HicB family nuclease
MPSRPRNDADKTVSIRHPFEVTFRRQPGGGYSASVAGLPGCFSEGDTLAEAEANIREAIGCHLEAMAIVARRAAKARPSPPRAKSTKANATP